MDVFYPNGIATPGVIAQVIAFSLDPFGFLSAVGKATGWCCCCGRLLTDEESVRNGIGPVCRERWGF